jgi:hypothetical protein
MMYTAEVAACSEIRTKHSTQSEHQVEFCVLLARKEDARLQRR